MLVWGFQLTESHAKRRKDKIRWQSDSKNEKLCQLFLSFEILIKLKEWMAEAIAEREHAMLRNRRRLSNEESETKVSRLMSEDVAYVHSLHCSRYLSLLHLNISESTENTNKRVKLSVIQQPLNAVSPLLTAKHQPAHFIIIYEKHIRESMHCFCQFHHELKRQMLAETLWQSFLMNYKRAAVNCNRKLGIEQMRIFRH